MTMGLCSLTLREVPLVHLSITGLYTWEVNWYILYQCLLYGFCSEFVVLVVFDHIIRTS